MSIGIIEYKLHKDNSWVGQEYNTPEEKAEYLKDLKDNGYTVDKITDYKAKALKEQVNNYYDWLMN